MMSNAIPFEDRAEKMRDAIKKIIDNELVVIQNNRQTKKISFELNFTQGGISGIKVLRDEYLAIS